MSAEDTEDSDGRPMTQRELLITINGKLDVFATELKAASVTTRDHETRIRIIEGGHYVTWRQFWAGIVGAATVAGALAALIPNVHIS